MTGGRRALRWLLLILPFVATLLPWIYNRAEPELFGMPFFYWYQLAWVLVTSGLLGALLLLDRRRDV
ncbi:MAG: DUF3311 domain-containing protein [Candidatus Eremiobacteraeota bacterium]|nr:DUF3311 domain-containing protein [Candidatus Eremiobacteraeota bacterium]